MNKYIRNYEHEIIEIDKPKLKLNPSPNKTKSKNEISPGKNKSILKTNSAGKRESLKS